LNIWIPGVISGGRIFQATLDALPPSRPLGVVGPAVECLGMGHQSKNTATGVADAGDVADRPIGVGWKLAGGRLTIRSGVLDDHLLVLHQGVDNGIGRHKLAFAMPNGQFQLLHATGKDTAGGRVHRQGHPVVPEIAAVVKGQGHGTPRIVGIDARQQPQVDQALEPVADADDEIAPVHKLQQPIADTGFHAHRLHHAGAMVVRPAESTDEAHNLKVVQGDRAVDQGIDVDAPGPGSGQFKGISRL
jgi:hypothetical protein